eukprot:scaffold84933_cov55-Phaeocystis_antarctica.AAC.2
MAGVCSSVWGSSPVWRTGSLPCARSMRSPAMGSVSCGRVGGGSLAAARARLAGTGRLRAVGRRGGGGRLSEARRGSGVLRQHGAVVLDGPLAQLPLPHQEVGGRGRGALTPAHRVGVRGQGQGSGLRSGSGLGSGLGLGLALVRGRVHLRNASSTSRWE